jgi:hypothetical protein
MTNTQIGGLVLKDAAGSYFLVSQEALERGRVPVEQKDEVERLVAEAAEDDVSGHAIMIGGFWFAPPAEDGNPAVPPTRVGVDGPSFDPPRLPRQPRGV